MSYQTDDIRKVLSIYQSSQRYLRLKLAAIHRHEKLSHNSKNPSKNAWILTYTIICGEISIKLVHLTGIEPARREALDPKSNVSASSTTGALASFLAVLL